jgi:transposase
MDSNLLLERLLHFGEAWHVDDIQVNESFKEIDILISYTKNTGICPILKSEQKIYDYGDLRRIRHLDLFEYKTFINTRIPRVINDKNDVTSIDLSWADSRVSYTYLFECKVIEALEMSKNQTRTAKYFNTTFDIVHMIMQRAVTRGLKRRNLDGIHSLCIDEKSYGNGQKYMTVLSDPITKCVLDIIEGRKTEDAEELITNTLSPAQLDNIELVTMDMWKPFMTAVEEVIPCADIAHDRFHTAKYLNNGVDEVRKQEIKEQVLLKNMKYIFLKDKSKWTKKQALKFEEINEINLVTSQAWQIKENFKGIYDQGRKELCMEYFKQWYENTFDSGIQQMIKVADTLLNHLKGVINSAVTDITNSVAENLNSQIQVVKSTGRGFANIRGYRNSILFFQGKLSLFPF